MDIITGNLGWIEVVCGPMFSGKSEELIRRLRRAMIARKRVEVFKPTIDDRYSVNEIVSHADVRLKSEVVASATEILDRVDPRVQVVGIDEANFMGRPFPPMPELLALAESITKTLAICMRCGNPAKHTQRLRGSDALIEVGASDSYEARCRRCFEPGIPKQEEMEFVKARKIEKP